MIAPVPPVVILSTADFDSDVWTNKQHLAVGLSRHTQVTYIESLGLRRPRLSVADVRRVLARVAARAGGRASTARRGRAVQPPSNVRVLSPFVLPWHGSALCRRVNARLLARFADAQLAHLPDAVLWTFSPMTYGLEERAAGTVYHSVDLLHAQPRMPRAELLRAECRLVARADRVVASSRVVRDHLRDAGARDPLLWENVADTALYRAAWSPQRLDRAIFAGNLTPTKIDVDLLTALARDGISLAIAGPAAIDGTSGAGFRELLDLPNVEYLGNLTPDRLAQEVGRSTVGLVPYLLNPYTAGVFPMKVYEYLAGGARVVSTRLPSLDGAGIGDGVILVDREDFVAGVRAALRDHTPTTAEQWASAAMSKSWTQRTSAAADLLGGVR